MSSRKFYVHFYVGAALHPKQRSLYAVIPAFCIHLLERNRFRQLQVQIYGLYIVARIPLQ